MSASPLPGLRTLRGRRSTHRSSRAPSCAHKLRWLEGWQVPFIIAPTENRHMRQEAQAICHLLPLGCAPHALGSPCSRATSSLPCQRSTRDRACRSHRRRRRCCRLHPRPHQPHPRVSRSATYIRLGPLMMPFPGKAPLHVLSDQCSGVHTHMHRMDVTRTGCPQAQPSHLRPQTDWPQLPPPCPRATQTGYRQPSCQAASRRD